MAAKKIRVLMTARQVVKYSQVKLLTKKEWDELKSQPPDVACEWINVDDVYDANEIEEFEAEVVDEQGTRIKPIDYYRGGK